MLYGVIKQGGYDDRHFGIPVIQQTVPVEGACAVNAHQGASQEGPDEGTIPLEEEVASRPPRASVDKKPAGASSLGPSPRAASKPSPGLHTGASSSGRKAERKCPKCGYSVVGLTKPICPECGTELNKALVKADRRAQARGALKQEYVKALISLGGGLAALALILLLKGEVVQLPAYIVMYAVFVPIGIAVYFACCLFWIGFDAPWGITTIRLAAVFAITDAASQLLDMIPFLFVGWILQLLIYVKLLEHYLDLEFHDAAIVGFLIGAAKFLIVMFLLNSILQDL